jgi:hypothetical protein
MQIAVITEPTAIRAFTSFDTVRDSSKVTQRAIDGSGKLLDRQATVQ